MSDVRFEVGAEVIWRSRPGDEIGYVLAGRVLLDVTVADDCSSWAMKDEDELDWAVEVGKISDAEHEAAHTAAAVAIADLTARAWPFHDEDWPPLTDDLLQPVELPPGWDRH